MLGEPGELTERRYLCRERNANLLEETVISPPRETEGPRVQQHSNYQVSGGPRLNSCLAENSKLARVIDLMSCFLVTSLCICGAECVVKKLETQIFQRLFGGAGIEKYNLKLLYKKPF